MPSLKTHVLQISLSILLVLSLLVSFGGTTIPVQAAGTLTTVYLNGSSGSDSNDGTSSSTPVKTFAAAKSLLSSGGGTIYITGQVIVADNETWNLSDYSSTTVMRGSGFLGNLIQVSSGGSLTLEDIVIDGNSSAVTAAGSLIYLYGGALTLGEGAILQNNHTSSYAGAIRTASGSKLTINGGTIQNNATASTSSSSGGAINLSTGSTFVMTSGEISGNTAASGSAIYVNGALYPQISPSAYISGVIYLNNSAAYLYMTGTPTHSLTLESASPAEGLVVARTSGYSLSSADWNKFGYNGSSWLYGLDTGNNTLYLTQSAPYSVTADSSITGGSLSVQPTAGIEGAEITVTVTPDSGKQLVSGSLKYSTDSGSTWTAINATSGSYVFTLPAANAVVTAEFTTATLSTVYLNGQDGDDAKSGVSAAKAVKTFERAKRLLSPDNGTIYLTSRLDAVYDETWSLDGYTNARVMRDPSYKGYLVQVGASASLTLDNIILDGNQSAVTANYALIYVAQYGHLTLNSGAVLQNNSSSGYGGAVRAKGALTMNGGEISNNTADLGGGIYTEFNNAIIINGGTITGNTATGGSGDAIYEAYAQQPVIGAGASISGLIYLGNSSAYLKITGAPANSLTVAVTDPYEGRVVAKGSDYSLTTADRDQIIYGEGDWLSGLNAASNNIYITEVTATEITLNQSSLTLEEGLTGQLTVTTTSDQTINWTSDNESAATVSSGGLVTAISSGTANITAATGVGNYTAVCTVTVTSPTATVTGVTLNQSTDLLIIGETEQLSAALSPGNAADKNMTWTSDNTSVATVSSSGLVTAEAEGSANITVNTDDGSYRATCALTVSSTQPVVYLAGGGGSDSNSGLSASYPVATFAMAKRRLAREGGVIYINSYMTITDTQVWDLSGYTDARVIRHTGDSISALIYVATGGSLTLSNIVIDGNKGAGPTGELILIEWSGSLVMNDGAVLQNNATDTQYSGAVYVQGNYDSFTMNGGKIINNQCLNEKGAGGVYIGTYGTFVMKGGEISGNTSAGAGGIYAAYGAICNLNSGTIAGNTSTAGAGNAIYAETGEYLSTIYVGSEAAVSGDIYLEESTQQLRITGLLSHVITVQTENTSESLVVARGSNYELTESDRAKVAYNGSGWYAVLSADDNTIYLTGVSSEVAVSGVALDRSEDILPVGATRQLTATIIPANAQNTNLTWDSTNPEVATVSSDGLVTAVSAGSTTITGNTTDGSYTADCAVTVLASPLAVVYLDGQTGSDDGYGASLSDAVKTFARAKDLLSTSDGTIYITGMVVTSGAETWDLSGYTNAVVKRHPSYTGYLIKTSGGDLTLSNIVIDGNRDNVIAAAPLIFLIPPYGGVQMIIDNGTVLRNNYTTSGPGAILTQGSTNTKSGAVSLTINGGSITNNNTNDGPGAIYETCTLEMNGGNISGNTGNICGGISAYGCISYSTVDGTLLSSAATNFNGGSITGNTATDTGYNAIYIQGNAVTLGPAAEITGNIALRNYGSGESCFDLKISGALTRNVILTSTKPTEGLVVAEGSSYTLTESDLAKLISGNSGWYFGLDTTNNEFYLTATAPSAFYVIADSEMSNGSLSFSPDNGTADTTITVTVTPEDGYQLINGSLKYSANGGSTWTVITAVEGVYSFSLPAATTLVTASFNAPVSGVSLDQSTANLAVNSTVQLAATFTPANASNQNITWSSDNTTAATVSSSGLVTAVSAGTANISVTTADGGYQAVCAVTVYYASVTGITLDKNTDSLLVGQTDQLTATIAPSDASNQNFTWSSDNTSVATVSNSGLIKGISSGSVVITVTTAECGFTAACSVTVVTATVTGVSLNRSSVTLAVGITNQLTATITPSNASNQSIAWTSDNTTAATVSSYGLITAVSPGTANITVTTADGDFTATCIVTAVKATSHTITAATLPDPIWTVTFDKTSAIAGETVMTTISDTAYSSWSTGLVVTGSATGTVYSYTTVTTATGNANGVNGSGVYSFLMPDEAVIVGFTADYTTLDIYMKNGSDSETLVHSYTRSEVEALAAQNTSPVWYAVYDRLPAVFMGKAVRYITIPQLAASAHSYNSAIHYDDASCTLTGLSLDGWTTNMSWSYLLGVTRKYYAGIGDQYLDAANQTGLDREVPPVLAITGWAGRETYVDNQAYDTYNTFRFFYGQTAAEYGNGVLPTTAEKDARCTAMNCAKMIYRMTFVMAQTYTVTADSSITGGTLSFSSANSLSGNTITVTVTPDSGMALVDGSLKYTTDNSTYTVITATDGVYSFTMPSADTVVTAQFASQNISVTGVSLDQSEVTLSVGSVGTLTATITPSDAPTRTVTWSSNNPAAATVNSSGLVRAVGTGTAAITVTTDDQQKTAVCAITVTAASTDHFTIAILPDTQYYSESYPEIFDNQTQWIANNITSRNIVFAAQTGDIVDDYDNATQWQNAGSAMAIIRNAGIPYSVVPGNHDLNFEAGDATQFDTYFPYTAFENYTWYGGHYSTASNTSSYQLFTAMGQNFIVLNLVCTPSLLTSATDWANSVLTQYSSRKAIVITHGYLKADGSYAGGDEISGPAIHENIVNGHSNVIAVICSHNAGEYYTTDTGTNGNTVYNLLTDYTDQDMGGNGWLRLYQFYPESDKLTAVTYSPYLNQYDTSTYGQFDLSLDMSVTTVPGDVNQDDSIDISDVVLTVNYALGKATPTDAQFNAADYNSDGTIDISDVVIIVNKALGR